MDDVNSALGMSIDTARTGRHCWRHFGLNDSRQFALPPATSALLSKADLVTTGQHVVKVPTDDIHKRMLTGLELATTPL
jgi:hypothetical protein